MIALYPGAFKPPHRGHFEVVKRLLNGTHNGHVYSIDDYKDVGTKALGGEKGKAEKINKVLVFPGGGERNGITKSESKAIWEIYAKYLPGLEVLDGEKNPMFAAKNYAKANEQDEFYAITGIRDESDFSDLKRITTFKNRNNVKGLLITPNKDANVRASDLRKAALSGNLDELRDFFPKQLSRVELLNILKMLKDNIIAEIMNEKMENLFNTMFSSEEQDSKVQENATNSKSLDNNNNQLDFLYSYTKDLMPFYADIEANESHLKISLKNNSIQEQNSNIPKFTKHIASILEYMFDQGMKITPLPEIKTVHDEENGEDFFGKTAYYDPNAREIVLYTAGRHPKDICRSFTHEMIHHMQNLEGRLGGINTTNTNEDDHLLEIEKEAYLKGNITFRNWEDSVKNVGDER